LEHDQVKPDANTIKRGFETKAVRRQHAVLFFLAPGVLMDEELLHNTKRQFFKTTDMGLESIVVLARSGPVGEFVEAENQRAAPMVAPLRQFSRPLTWAWDLSWCLPARALWVSSSRPRTSGRLDA
jgi:hypothetical protein